MPCALRRPRALTTTVTPGEPTSVDRKGADPAPENFEEQDRQGNVKQNTTNQGHQRDR